MKKLCILLFLLVFNLLSVFSQDSAFVRPPLFSRMEAPGERGVIRLRQDTRVEMLVAKQIQESGLPGSGIPGFRICIFSQTGQQARKQSESVLNSYLKAFPDTAYLGYSEPAFTVMVGDYRTKSDALRALNNVRKVFRSGFIVSTTINPPKI